jgi:hypothetical protein
LSRFAAWLLLAVLLTLLVFGTQMPGAWRDETFRVTHLPGQLADVAHFGLFAGIAALDDWLADAVGICLGLWVARGGMDCRVAGAPRNDGGYSSLRAQRAIHGWLLLYDARTG